MTRSTACKCAFWQTPQKTVLKNKEQRTTCQILVKNPVNRYRFYPAQHEWVFNHTPQMHKMGTSILAALSNGETRWAVIPYLEQSNYNATKTIS